tara:strand:- start:27 stop:686 length:660 start_codon:yes stop_codon:yes gene_type:complete
MSKIIVALDNTDVQANIEIASKLKNKVDGFKINHLMWEYTDAIRDLADELFIDCKLWDTPNTVKQVVQKIVDKGATMTTICTHNNRAVFEEIQPFTDQIKLLGVTYLTSWTGSDLLEIMNYLPGGVRVMWRDNIDKIKPYGFAGMICSPKDLEVVKPLTYGMIKVCPGIGTNKGQVRTVSARQATDMGANYLVIGRTITESIDPVETIQNIKEELINTL